MPSIQRLQISPTPRPLGDAPSSAGRKGMVPDARGVGGAADGGGAGGRRAEFRALRRAYLSSDAKPQVAVVTGPSGIGKSYFVRQSLDVICRHNDEGGGGDGGEGGSFVVSGKCNEMNQNQPYACVVEALGVLCKQLSRLELQQESIQKEILTALNGEGQVLVDFVPNSRDVIGDLHEELRELKGKERRVRLERVVRRFLQAVSSFCPVVLQLDDLQWADGPTMDLIGCLSTSPNLRGLLLICVYRENDADTKRKWLDKYFLQLKGEDASITNIQIQPLTSMRGLVDSSGLDLAPGDASKIAEWLQEHSKGNTFFAVRLLGYLMCRNDAKSGRMVEELDSLPVPPTLEDLLGIEINALPPFTRDALIRASCIGFYFDDFVLKQAILLPCIDDEVTKLPSFRRQSCLSEAITVAKRMGLVEGMKLGYRFIHDSLWKALYNMLSTDKRKRLHLEIGRVMKKRLRPSQGGPSRNDKRTRKNTVGVSEVEMESFIARYLCSTVDQFNRAGTDLMSSEEIIELMLMNIRAAELSALDCSWESAMQYLEHTKPMLQKDEHWMYRYDLCLLVNNLYAEISLSLCNFEAAAQTVDVVLRNGKSIDDTYGAYLVLMRSLNSQKKTADALSIASDVLDQLGVDAAWIKQDAVSEKNTFRKEVKKLVKKQSWLAVSSLEQISDERKLKAVKVFYWLLIAAYGTELHELVAGKILQLTVEHGFSEEGINGILTYASGYLPLSKKKNEILRAAIQLHERVKSDRLTHDYCLILGGYLQCWSSPLRESLATLLEGLKMGSKYGHIDNAAICGSLLSSYSLFSGEKLEIVEGRMRSFADWAKEERLYGSSRLGFLPFLQLVKCLQQGGSGDRDSILAGEEMDTKEISAAAESPMVACSLALCRLELACIFGDYPLAGEILSGAPDLLKTRPGHFSGCRFTFYEFLACAQLARGSKKSSSTWSKRAHAAQKQLQDWAKNGVDCDRLIPLVEAEFALVKGKKSSAAKHFDRVVKSVEKEKASGYNLQDRAISLERAALFYHSKGDVATAATCYSRSRDLYEEWGAGAKVRAMETNEKWSQGLEM